MPDPVRMTTVAILAVIAMALLAGCGTSGTELRDPPPGATAPLSPTTAPPQAAASTAPGFFTISSPTISPGGQIPAAYTCNGEDISPPFAWSAVPGATAELGLVVTGPAPDFEVLWVTTGLDPAASGIGEGIVPDGAVESLNSGGGAGWAGPCPAAGETASYAVTAYAFFEPLNMAEGLPAADAAALVGDVFSSQATMTALYTGA